MNKLSDKAIASVGVFIGTSASAFAFLVGGIDDLIRVFIFFLAFDYIAGVLKAIYKKNINSQIGAKGIVRKLAKFLLIAIAYLTEYLLKINAPIRTTVISFLIANEAISIIENLAIMDIPVIDKLKPILKQAHAQIEKKIEKMCDVFIGENKDDKESEGKDE